MAEAKNRLVFPCADGYGNLKCYICDINSDDFTSVKSLYEHLLHWHNCSEWRDIFPVDLTDATAVIVRHTLLDDYSDYDNHHDQSSNLTVINQEACRLRAISLRKCKVKKNKRGRPATGKNVIDDEVLASKKSKKEEVSQPDLVVDYPDAIAEAKMATGGSVKNDDNDQVLPSKKFKINGEVSTNLAVGFPAAIAEAKMATGAGVISRMGFNFDLNIPALPCDDERDEAEDGIPLITSF